MRLWSVVSSHDLHAVVGVQVVGVRRPGARRRRLGSSWRRRPPAGRAVAAGASVAGAAAPRRPRPAAGAVQRLDVGDELHQVLLADQALVGRHDRLEARPRPWPPGSGSTRGCRPRRRSRSPPLGQRAPGLPKRPVERGPARPGVGAVAGDAAAGPGRASRPPRPASPPRRRPASQAWKAAGSITTTEPIIPECLVPQYSAQKRW